MRATEIDVTLRNGSHTDLIKSPGEKGGKGASKSNSPVASGTANCNAHLGGGRGRKSVNGEGTEKGTRWSLGVFTVKPFILVMSTSMNSYLKSLTFTNFNLVPVNGTFP